MHVAEVACLLVLCLCLICHASYRALPPGSWLLALGWGQGYADFLTISARMLRIIGLRLISGKSHHSIILLISSVTLQKWQEIFWFTIFSFTKCMWWYPAMRIARKNQWLIQSRWLASGRNPKVLLSRSCCYWVISSPSDDYLWLIPLTTLASSRCMAPLPSDLFSYRSSVLLSPWKSKKKQVLVTALQWVVWYCTSGPGSTLSRHPAYSQTAVT